MAISLIHPFVSAVADDGDATKVQPSNWNAEHTLTLATARLVGRTTAGTGAAEEISVGAGLTLAAGALTATGTGDFVGPASSTDNALVRFDGTTGKLGQNSSGATLSDGFALSLAGGTVTASGPLLNVTQTWNNAAVTFTGLFANFTDTASANASKALDIQVGGVSKLSFQPKTASAFGILTIDSTASGNGAVNAPTLLGVMINGTEKARFNSTELNLGTYKINWAATVGGAADAGLTRNAAGVVEVNNGTAGTFRDLKLRNLLAAGGNGSYIQTPSMTVANLAAAATAGAGARAFVTDALAPVWGAAVAGAGAVKVPVYSDGAGWFVG